MLNTTIGSSCLLARPGDRRIWLLDRASVALWDLRTAGWSSDPLAKLLAEHFGLALDAARAYVTQLEVQWRQVGLLDTDTSQALRLGGADDPVWPSPCPRPLPADAWRLRVADRRLGVRVSAPDLWETLRGWLFPAAGGEELDPVQATEHRRSAPDALPPTQEIDHEVGLDLSPEGSPTTWRLTLDGTLRETGAGRDGALVATLSLLTELGCRPAERLLVIHGAGLIGPDGRGLLLVAPGGSGKSTLTAALTAQGFGLLSDDVVPVTLEGELLGLGLPLCLKAGSWPVLAGVRPDLARAPTLDRFGQRVRFLSSVGPATSGPVRPACCLLPRYDPDHPAVVRRLAPEETLQGIIAAEAVLRDLTQAKLAVLARWVSDLPAFAISYPTLDQGLALVHDLLRRDSPQ